MLHHIVTLASYKSIGATTCGFMSPQWMKLLMLTVKVKCASHVHNVFLYRIRNSFAKSVRCWLYSLVQHIDVLIPVWKHADYRKQSLGPLFSLYPMHKLHLLQFVRVLKSLCDVLLEQYNQKQFVVRIAVSYRWSQFLRIYLLNHAMLLGYMDDLFGNSFDGKYISLPQHSYHRDSRLLLIHQKSIFGARLFVDMRKPSSEE